MLPPTVSEPPVMLIVLDVKALAFEAFAILMPPEMVVAPPLMFKVETEVLFVPVEDELFTFMFSVVIPIVLPDMLTVDWAGPPAT